MTVRFKTGDMNIDLTKFTCEEDSKEKILISISECDKCELKEHEFNKREYIREILDGRNLAERKLMVVLQNPSSNRGYTDKRVLAPGTANNDTFNLAIDKALNIGRWDFYATNVVKCSTLNNKPISKIPEHCKLYLKREIALVKPKLVIAVGKTSCTHFGVSFGQLLQHDLFYLYGVRHPAFYLRQGWSYKEYIREFDILKEKIQGIGGF